MIGADSADFAAAGTKRTVDVPIYYVDSGVIYTWATRGGANICSGDSGGAALRPDDTTGELELVGVNSFGFMADGSREVLCDDPDAIAGVSRVDVDMDWFIEYMGEEPEPEPEEEDDAVADTGVVVDTGAPEALEADDDDGGKKASGCSAVGGVAGGTVLTLALMGAAARRRED